MKQKILLFILLLTFTLSGFSTVWTVNNSGTAFSPANITIKPGDSVRFTITSSHNAVEVSQATYNAGGNAQLSGGFQLPYGGGLLLPAQLPEGTHYYVCTPHASFGMKGTIVVTNCASPATPGAISGNTSVCGGSSNTYSVTAVAGATSYTWTLPGGWSGSSTSNSISATAGSSGGTISVKANNACGSSAVRTLAVTVSTAPATPGIINGNLTVCSGSSNTYSVVEVPGATSYVWTLPGGWSGTSTSNSITATAGNTGGNITVKASNSCGSSVAQTLTVNATSIPATPGTISGTSTVCAGSLNTYSVANVSGASSYTWTLPVGWTGSSTMNSIDVVTGSTGGTISVLASNNCGSSSSVTLSVTVNSKPATPGAISGISAICTGSSNTYSIAAVAGATSYNWTLPGGWSGTSTSNSITATAGNIGGNITVSAINSCGSSSSQPFTVTVTNAPATPGSISGSVTVCAKSVNTYSIAAVAGATSYTWTLPGGWTGTSTTNSISAKTGNSGGNITVTALNSCGTSSPRTLGVTVNSVNVAAVQSDKLITASLAGAQYQWIDCKTKAPLPGQTNQSFTATTNGSYAVIVTSGSCADTSACFSVTTVGARLISDTAPELMVYPNPTDGKIFLESTSFEFAKGLLLMIYNSTGKLILKIKSEDKKPEIDLSMYPSGVYFIKLTNDSVTLTKQIVLQK